jgi:hypothetical protein
MRYMNRGRSPSCSGHKTKCQPFGIQQEAQIGSARHDTQGLFHDAVEGIIVFLRAKDLHPFHTTG